MHILTRAVAITSVLVLAVAPVTAGPILDSAIRYASQIQPARSGQACWHATSAGEQAGVEGSSGVGWFLGGLALPVVAPLLARGARPDPPVSLLAGRDLAARECFRDGYRRDGRGEKVRGAWIGSGIGVALWVAGIALATTGVEMPDEYSGGLMPDDGFGFGF